MKIILLILFLLLLVAGSIYFMGPATLPEDIDNLFFEFKAEAKRRDFPLRLNGFLWGFKFDTIADLRAGKCSSNLGWSTISIDPQKWSRLDSFQRRALLFHEWGHCILGRKHRNEKLSSGECSSLMDGSEYGFFCSNNFYSDKWWNYYVDELFDSTIQGPSWCHMNKIDTFIYCYKTELLHDCQENRDGYRLCTLRENFSIVEKQSLLLVINLSGIDWRTSNGIRFQLNDIALWVDMPHKTIVVQRSSEKISALDAHYFLLKDADRRFPKLDRIEVEIKGGWIYFYVNNIQVHLMEFTNTLEDISISNSVSSPIGNWLVYH